MKTQRGYTAAEIVFLGWFLLIGAGVIGWVWNIVKVIHTCCTVIDGLLVARIIGIFVAPLGAVLGFF